MGSLNAQIVSPYTVRSLRGCLQLFALSPHDVPQATEVKLTVCSAGAVKEVVRTGFFWGRGPCCPVDAARRKIFSRRHGSGWVYHANEYTLPGCQHHCPFQFPIARRPPSKIYYDPKQTTVSTLCRGYRRINPLRWTQGAICIICRGASAQRDHRGHSQMWNLRLFIRLLAFLY